MNSNRLEAFSDGVLAIIITIMVLELKIPHGTDIESLLPVLPVFLSYILSFIYVGIYWNNHHHMMHTVNTVSGGMLWANLHLLFWLSLIPFVTGWIGENHFAELPMAMYGGVLLMAAIAYFILQNRILATQAKDSLLAKAVGKDLKGKVSPIIYSVAILFAFYSPLVAGSLYILVALMWLIPDKRIEIILKSKE
ncbi:TMEM175 family protein [Aequorivita sp. SDUM287046]|uniref:TMEM175 family protein n=1 Tax=Aequorivita aurantiaca TaxID=3053356 RepID=A0ABT8DD85_9FLAO|nr:TMEM175 family protein [Aequorivita aurantiaca]MDN3723167.1 TMEM175 family protein [Aequorivita aurantiaca]